MKAILSVALVLVGALVLGVGGLARAAGTFGEGVHRLGDVGDRHALALKTVERIFLVS